jgi:hypothetical protein
MRRAIRVAPATTQRADAPGVSRAIGGLLAAAMVIAAVAACSDADRPATAGAVGSATAAPTATTASPGTPTSSPTVPGTTAGPTVTPVPGAVPKVTRPGQPGRPTVGAAPGRFGGAVGYPDGVRLTVDRVLTGVETGKGPGAFAGREYATFTITLTNGSRATLDLQQVVVSAGYGSRNRPAVPVYAQGTGAVDFGGRLAPRARSSARYAFAVPAAELGRVRLVVDFDGIHTSAEFNGSAKPVAR